MSAVWIGCLASYNAGRHVGQWFELGDFDDSDELAKAVDAVILGEEWHVCDAEGFGPFDIGRYSSLEEIMVAADIVAAFEEDDELDVLSAAAAIFGVDYLHERLVASGADWVRERFAGTSEKPGEFAEVHESHDLGHLGHLALYIDWERVERDMSDFRSHEINGTNYWFHNE